MRKSVRQVDQVVLRPATEADVPGLVALPFSGGLPSNHLDRYHRQQRDEAIYLLATDADQIVGHLLLKWDGPSAPRLRPLVPPCAEVEDFVVMPALRGRGIGGAMLTLAGRLCQERGVARLGIGVGIENPRAHALYERHAFILVPQSEHRVSWPALDQSGRKVREYEDCVYLIKELV